MTATVSTNSNNPKKEKRVSPALHNWRQNIAGDKKLFIILSILHLIAAPAVILAVIIFIYSGKGMYGDTEVYLTIGAVTTALAGFLGIFPAVDSFSCLHNKSVVDMKLSLPMTAKQRFFSNYLSGLFTYIAPFLGAQIVSLLLMGYGFIFMEGRTFYDTYYDQDGELVKNPYVCDIFSQAAPVLFKLILCGILAMLMLYTVTVLITVCCGSKFESIAYTILINGLIPLTVVCVAFSIFDNLYGIDPTTPMYKIISYTSVTGAIFVAFDWVAGEEILYGSEEWLNYGAWALVYLLIIAAIGALAFFLYRKRRAEQVSKPFVFKLAYYITITCAMFCLVSLLIVDSTSGLIPAIIITAIVYMIFEVVTNRGFKRFWLSIIKYAVTFLAAFGLIAAGSSTDGFGAVSRIPSLSSVASVEVEGYAMSGSYRFFDYMSSWYANVISMENGDVYFDDRNEPMVFTDKENIGIILDAHKAMIDFYDRYKTDDFIGGRHDSLSNYATSHGGIIIRYNLKGGRSLTRYYDCYDWATEDILSALDTTEEYKTQTAERYRKYIAQIPTIYYDHEMEYIRKNPDAKSFYAGRDRVYDVTVSSGMIGGRSAEGISIESLCRRGFYEQLADAYAKDIMAITEENYYYSDLRNIWTVYLTGDMIFGNGYITVPESFENTVELLEYFDFDLSRIEDASDEEILYTLIRLAATGNVGIFTTEEYRGIRSYLGNAFVLSKDGPNEFYVYDFGEDMFDLVRGALPMHIADENGYIISIYGTSYTVPEELWDTARRVPRSERNGDIERLYMETVQGESNDYY
ncbi:MAG: ABC transporter permease [Ruminococcus sp.]|nr:ABC transporter permease [Ruminococcus sp.]